MEINDALIDRLEILSKLKLSTVEREIIKKDLTKILGMIDKIQEVNTEGVEPLRHINSLHNVLRDDESSNELTREEALKNAPEKDDEYFLVPKVINL